MTTIEKIKILKKLIRQDGACGGITCSECRKTLFRSVPDNKVYDCRDMHKYCNLPFDSSVDFIAPKAVALAKTELKNLLIEISEGENT